MKYLLIIALLVILFVIFSLKFKNKSESFISIDKLQIRTGRNYSDCIIKKNMNKISIINNYLKNNPQRIPKVIHQIWIGPKKIPWTWINSFKINFRNKYRGWKYYLWTDKEVQKLNLKNKSKYNSEKTYNGKSDILRYELLNMFGGIYIDADSQWLGLNLNDLIEKTNYTGFFAANECQNCKDSLASGVVGSSINNPITKYLIELISENYSRCSKYPPYKTIGPYFLDQILYELNVTIFPYYYFYPIYWRGKESVDMDIETQKIKFPKSYMTQYGFTTNSLKT